MVSAIHWKEAKNIIKNPVLAPINAEMVRNEIIIKTKSGEYIGDKELVVEALASLLAKLDGLTGEELDELYQAAELRAKEKTAKPSLEVAKKLAELEGINLSPDEILSLIKQHKK